MARMAQSDEEDRVDARLLAEIAAGSEQAFVELYRRRHNDIYRFAVAMARSRSFAQDVVQEVFLNVLENAGRFDRAKGSARAWLCGCARHLTLDRLRLERRWTDELPADDSAQDGDERLFADQRIERLQAALARLPVEYREALVLVDLQELGYAEAAVVLDCPIGTVRSRLHRGRLALAAMFEERAPCAERADVGAPLQAREVCP